jgi:regulator of protease activity HflC (stomatin/prohibitin superfamily)
MERRAFRLPGFPVLLVAIAQPIATVAWLRHLNAQQEHLASTLVVIFGLLVLLALWTGFFVLSPNESRVVLFFGWYAGTVRRPGFHWTVPFSVKRKISLRVRNFESAVLKVADSDGNPVQIAAVVVWRVFDTAKAAFAVSDHVQYVAVQAEAAVRHLATLHPYEAHETGTASLRDAALVSVELTDELRDRVALAGIEVLESRITHLAYAPEIAQAMLARQQASAIVAARFKIVEGAVGMVQQALQRLRENDIVDLDEERKAQMVANLLVVLCGDRAAQPIVNAGTLY